MESLGYSQDDWGNIDPALNGRDVDVVPPVFDEGPSLLGSGLHQRNSAHSPPPDHLDRGTARGPAFNLQGSISSRGFPSDVGPYASRYAGNQPAILHGNGPGYSQISNPPSHPNYRQASGRVFGGFEYGGGTSDFAGNDAADITPENIFANRQFHFTRFSSKRPSCYWALVHVVIGVVFTCPKLIESGTTMTMMNRLLSYGDPDKVSCFTSEDFDQYSAIYRCESHGMDAWLDYLRLMWQEQDRQFEWILNGLSKGFRHGADPNSGLDIELYARPENCFISRYLDREQERIDLRLANQVHMWKKICADVIAEAVQCDVVRPGEDMTDTWSNSHRPVVHTQHRSRMDGARRSRFEPDNPMPNLPRGDGQRHVACLRELVEVHYNSFTDDEKRSKARFQSLHYLPQAPSSLGNATGQALMENRVIATPRSLKRGATIGTPSARHKRPSIMGLDSPWNPERLNLPSAGVTGSPRADPFKSPERVNTPRVRPLLERSQSALDSMSSPPPSPPVLGSKHTPERQFTPSQLPALNRPLNASPLRRSMKAEFNRPAPETEANMDMSPTTKRALEIVGENVAIPQTGSPVLRDVAQNDRLFQSSP